MKTIHKAYKFRLKTTPEQNACFAQIAGVCRLVWNLCLAQRIQAYGSQRKSLNSYKQGLELTELRRQYDWIKAVPVHVAQQAMHNLDRAYSNFFKGLGGFPKFKKKGKTRDSFRFPDGFKLDNRRVCLPKTGWIGFFKSQEILGTPRHITVSRHGRHWFMSVAYEVQMADASVPPCEVGIDMGVAKLCAMSDGTVVENPRALGRHKTKLAKLQRRLARKARNSNNYRKLSVKIVALHARIADIRKDKISKETTIIAKNHGMVVLEDLKVKAMSKSARGTVDAPGRNVRQKSGLNRAILDAGWGEFRRQLEYKLAWNGGVLVLVDPRNTSRKCSVCGHTAKENRLSQASFLCVKCGHRSDADVNAAKNILAAGHAVLACQASGAAMPPATGTLGRAA